MEGSTSVWLWWGGMSAIALLNVGLLIYSYRIYRKRIPAYSHLLVRARNWQLMLSAAYVIGCGFRSIVPRGDLRRIVLFDSFISAVFIGRSVATVAELCLAAQCAWMLWEIGRSTGDKRISTIARILVPMLAVAEVFSWYACLTTNYLGTTVEESLWGLAAFLVLISFIWARPLYEFKQRRFLTYGIAAAGSYFLYMVIVDVPAYVRGYLADTAVGKTYATLSDGLHEVLHTWTVTRAYADWRYEMIWMTLYFSLAVWGSMLLINAPRMDQGLRLQHRGG